MASRIRRLFSLTACVAALTGVSACGNGAEEASKQAQVSPAPHQGEEVAALISQGIALGQEGKVDQAKAAFERATQLDERNKYAWYNLGYLAQAANQADVAIAHYDRAIAADESYTPAMYNKAILLEAKDAAAAVALYQKILTINPDASTTHARLGMLYASKGDEKAAQQEFNAALKADPALKDAIPAKYRVSTGG